MPGLSLVTIQANNQAIEQETQAEETAKQAIQKEQEKQAKTSNEIKQRQAENEAAIKEKIEIEKSLKKLQNTQRSHKPAKKATKEEDQIAKNILAAKVNEARKLDGEKKRIVKATTDALTTANQQLQETEKTIETANKSFNFFFYCRFVFGLSLFDFVAGFCLFLLFFLDGLFCGFKAKH
jgi:ABC-type antimicrobial peptide transport system permease subunit